MLSRIAEINLKSKIKRLIINRTKQFINWNKIEKIALILNQNDAINKSAIDTFIQQSGKYVEVFYVEIKSNQPTYADWNCYYKKDLNLLKLPKKSVLNELKNKNFDLVINTSNDDDLFSPLLTTTLNASLRCGNNNKYNCHELIIKKANTNDLIVHLNNVVKYLKMIHT